jgi:hypothetical protein
MSATLLLAIALVVATGAAMWFYVRSRLRPKTSIAIHSSIREIREIGHLSALKVATKEIVTETKHDWGDIGERYFGWVLSSKRMVIIFEFQIDFRYDLRSAGFRVERTGGQVVIDCPPCTCEVLLRDITFYDEQRGRFLPWLLPDLMNGYFSRGFSTQDKNDLIAAAKRQAEVQARVVIENFRAAAEHSATATLRALCRSFGATDVVVHFDHPETQRVTVSFETAAA